MTRARGARLEAAALDGLSTGVGSLPSRTPEEAIDLVLRCCPELPFWPQLPGIAASEGAIQQGLAGLEEELAPGDGPFLHEIRDRRRFLLAAAAPPAWGEAHARGLVALEAALLDGKLAGARALKGQLFGPVTLAASLRWQGAPIWDDPGLLRALGVRVAWQAADQAARLRRGRVPVILALDEPGLGMLSGAALAPDGAAFEALTWALAAIQANGAAAALHCCSPPPWSLLARLPVELISFDASRDAASLLADASGRALAASRWIAWGLVPTDTPPGALDPEAVALTWASSLSLAGLDPRGVGRRALVTPACGLAGHGPEAAEQLLLQARAIGAAIRELTRSTLGRD